MENFKDLFSFQNTNNCGIKKPLIGSFNELSFFSEIGLLSSCPSTSTQIRYDFNGDGIADILVGANLDDDGGADSGVAFIFYVSTSLASSIDSSLANVKLIGEDIDDLFGTSVSGGN